MKHLLTSLPLKICLPKTTMEKKEKIKNEWNKSKCVVAAHCRRNRCHCRRQNFLSHKLNGMRKWKLLTFIGLRHTLAMVCVWMFLIKFVWIWNFSFNEISSLDRDILIDSKWKIAFAKTQNEPVHAYQRHTHTHIPYTETNAKNEIGATIPSVAIVSHSLRCRRHRFIPMRKTFTTCVNYLY